ncbi:FAD-binding oxidoreductase [Aminobacter sp. AP02]|uniref:NAD(P)/FAD-dependent oxidoreductase n=1 Tax=Aminobacter sp. AP02 TaxID=2135737 RepID=UPI000D6ACA7E|nr:FAD-binding oxidoreductase [Aminobacter sp. AP02]PWK76925.1 D-arginine dehydrogenase [Aminobacter sp. AP02]
MDYHDVIVIGGGVAGASAAAEIAAHAKVLVLEAEDQPGYHSTGRSAAFFTTTYGNSASQALGRISEPFFRNPPEEFSESPLLHPRDQIVVANGDGLGRLEAMQQGIASDVTPISVSDAIGRVPVLNADEVAGAFLDRTGGELDAGAILGGYIKLLKQRGGVLVGNARVSALSYRDGLWTVTTERGDSYSSPTVINAAGAWADQVAKLAGLDPLGIKPLRRTAVLVPPSEGTEVADWPMVVHLSGELYFKPDAGMILVSPMDETEDVPGDVQADEYDVAVAVDRLINNTSVTVQNVPHKWAGFRCFASDRNPVVGYDPRSNGFFWLAGQGGFGVGTAPALAHLTCALVTGEKIPPVYDRVLHLTSALAPGRLLS